MRLGFAINRMLEWGGKKKHTSSSVRILKISRFSINNVLVCVLLCADSDLSLSVSLPLNILQGVD